MPVIEEIGKQFFSGPTLDRAQRVVRDFNKSYPAPFNPKKMGCTNYCLRA